MNPFTAFASTIRSNLDDLSECPRELWLSYLLKMFASFAYFSMSINLTIFLSEEFDFSDTEAGVLYGVWGVLISAYGLIAGGLIDRLGVRTSLIVGSIFAAAGRFLIAVAWARWVVYICLFALIPFGEALAVPVLTIGIKRYTNQKTRVSAFALFYAAMNVASLLSGPITDFFRWVFASGFNLGGAHITPIRLVFLVGCGFTVLYLIVAWRYFREINVSATGEVEEHRPPQQDTGAMLCETLRDSRFWRLGLFTLLILFVKLLFRHLDATFPKYVLRELGPDTPYGSMYAINPAMVIIAVPIIGVYFKDVHPFKMILRGSFVTAAAPFVLIFSPSYFTACLFVVVLSLGEVVYSPPVYTYTMILAPKGREGLYTTLASAPMFVAKLFAGGLSGVLLDQYCPADPPRHCGSMWLIIGCISAASPVGMLLLQKVIQPEGTDSPMQSDEDKETAGLGKALRQSGEGDEQAAFSDDAHGTSGGPEDRVGGSLASKASVHDASYRMALLGAGEAIAEEGGESAQDKAALDV